MSEIVDLGEGEFPLGEDFTLRVRVVDPDTGAPASLSALATLEFRVKLTAEHETTAYSVADASITVSTTTVSRDTISIPVTSSGTDGMSQGEYVYAVGRIDSGNRRTLVSGTLVATRSAISA